MLFRNKAQLLNVALKDGLAVEVRATPTIYEARGDFQLSVDTVRLAGLGALYEQFAKLKASLDAAGWFSAERKRALPAFPRAVGIVTSRHAAALRDVLTTLDRRLPSLPVILYPAPVQGSDAAASIAAAIATANARAEVDVLIVCRGGGSIEDLWAFNELAVAKRGIRVEASVGQRRRSRNRLHDLRFRRRRARTDADRGGGTRRSRPQRAPRASAGDRAALAPLDRARARIAHATARPRLAPAGPPRRATAGPGAGHFGPRAALAARRREYRAPARARVTRHTGCA